MTKLGITDLVLGSRLNFLDPPLQKKKEGKSAPNKKIVERLN